MIIFKKFLSVFLLFNFLYLLFPCFAFADNQERKIYPTKIKFVKKDGKYGAIDKNTNEVVIPYEYDKISGSKNNNYNGGRLIVKKNNKYGLVTYKNEIILPVENDYIKSTKGGYLYKINNKKGINDRFHNTLPPEYDDIVTKREFALIFNDKPYINYGIKNDKKTVHTKELNVFTQLDLQLTVVDSKDKYGFIYSPKEDTTSAYSIPIIYEDYYFPDKNSSQFSYYGATEYINNNNIVTKQNNKWGVIDTNNNTIINFEYDDIFMFDAYIKEVLDKNSTYSYKGYRKYETPINDKYIATKNNKIYILDLKGNILYEGKKPEIKYNTEAENMIEDIYSQNNSQSLIKFSHFPSEGIVKYKNGKKYGLYIVKNSGLTILPAIYDDFKFSDDNSVIFHLLNISFAPEGQILAKKGRKWIIIDNIENYSDKKNIKTDNFITYSPEIKNSVDFNKNSITINFNGIEFSKNILPYKSKDLLKNKLWALATEKVAVQPTKTIFGQPDIKTIKSNYYYRGGYYKEDFLTRLAEPFVFLGAMLIFIIWNILKFFMK